MPTYAWPSPLDIYDNDGNGYILHAARSGSLHLIDGLTGKEISYIRTEPSLDFNYTEASPAIFNDILVIASRYSKVYGVKIK